METIGQPLEFNGINMYSGSCILRAGSSGRPERVPEPVGQPMTPYQWPVMPSLKRWGPRFFHERYGLVHVDFETGKRTAKDSARWYAEVIRTNGANL
jgi:beta-glucosidase